MSDVYCAKCGEPWDSQGLRLGDMKRSEAKRFKRGEGCPSCEFGTICTQCNGTKTAPVAYGPGRCATCFGGGAVIVRRLLAPRTATISTANWQFGYIPNVRKGPAPYKKIRRYESADGPVEEGWAWCPDCNNSGPVCQHCNGTGEFQPLPQEVDAPGKALWSLIEATDEDGLDLIDEFQF